MPRPLRASIGYSPPPSISTQGNSWIERVFGGTPGDEATSNPPATVDQVGPSSPPTPAPDAAAFTPTEIKNMERDLP